MSIYSLTNGSEFLTHNACDVKKKAQINIDLMLVSISNVFDNFHEYHYNDDYFVSD